MHLFPRRLRSRLVLLLLLAVAAAETVTYLLLADERRFALLAARDAELVERTAGLLMLLDTLPAEQHPALLAAASTRDLVFFLDSRDLADAYGGIPATELEQRLADRLAIAPDVVAVRLLEDAPPRPAPSPPAEPWVGVALLEDDPLPPDDPLFLVAPDWFDAARLVARARRALLVSIARPDGLTLNAVLAFERLPAFFALQGVLLATAAGMAVAVVAWLALAGLTRPLARLAAAADDFGRGRRVSDLPEHGPEEVRRLVVAFNRMRERLERLLQDRAQVLAAIGHDLRTPLTALRLKAEFVEDGELRGRILGLLDEMQETVEAALAFLRAEHAREPVRPVDLVALVESLVADLVDHGQRVELVARTPAVVSVRARAVRRAIRNLLENAVRYGGSARVRLTADRREVRVVIEDDGPGIPEDRLERVFEPFVRLERSRSRATGGTGLGLAIARTIARAHGGDVRLENRTEGGLRATLVLPR